MRGVAGEGDALRDIAVCVPELEGEGGYASFLDADNAGRNMTTRGTDDGFTPGYFLGDVDLGVGWWRGEVGEVDCWEAEAGVDERGEGGGGEGGEGFGVLRGGGPDEGGVVAWELWDVR